MKKNKRNLKKTYVIVIFILTISTAITALYSTNVAVGKNHGKEVNTAVKKNEVVVSSDIGKKDNENSKMQGDKKEQQINQQNYNTKTTENSMAMEKYDSFFKRDIFIGDSITQGISEFDFLPEENVCAKLGINLTQVDAQIEKAKKLNPNRIYLLLGSNDLEYGGTTPDIFKQRYQKVLEKIKKTIPNAKIYVQSILPVLPKASKNNSLVNNTRIGQFNAEIAALAKEENLNYLNIASLIDDYTKNLYEPDGEHFKSKFYTLWLNYIEKNVK
ncbi:GDSL-type esterase/lipase family protein [Clostridium sp. C8-1-8]|uniref:GDSL-type esterase/lipase family protein n=1 Tax=Clostridium sp. C8-1-8 TaxID=2698831 RepID=UPI00136C7FB4|nr:GDSL-type esterase/lipase family protein [Clostridium sp. C8-1-8]